MAKQLEALGGRIWWQEDPDLGAIGTVLMVLAEALNADMMSDKGVKDLLGRARTMGHRVGVTVPTMDRREAYEAAVSEVQDYLNGKGTSAALAESVLSTKNRSQWPGERVHAHSVAVRVIKAVNAAGYDIDAQEWLVRLKANPRAPKTAEDIVQLAYHASGVPPAVLSKMLEAERMKRRRDANSGK